MEPSAVREMASHLASGERLVWAGRPAPLPYAIFEIDWRFPVVGLVALLIAILLATAASGLAGFADAGLMRLVVILIGLPILVTCLAVLAGPVRRWRESRQLVYGLTDRRAIILVGGVRSRIEEIAPDRFLPPRTIPNRDGTVNLLFYEEARLAPGKSTPAIAFHRRGFIGIDPPQEVEQQLARMASSAR